MNAPLLLPVDPQHPDPEHLERAAGILRAGGLVAFPTETVYGLGADARNPRAVARIFEAKGRPADNPLIVHVADVEAAKAYAAYWPAIATRLAEAFWPGPLTLLVPKVPEIPDLVTAGLPAVGLRVPAHPVARALIQQAGIPVAAPSANPYMGISPTTAQHVAAGLGDRVDLILDGGPAEVGIESTVLDLTGEIPVVLRPGGVSLDAIRAIAPEAIARSEVLDVGPRLSPGLARRHYAPKATLRLVEGREAMRQIAASELGLRIALVTVGPALEAAAGLIQRALPHDPAGYAARLYATLHELDAAGVDLILAERPPSDPTWAAVNDRLQRAAADR